MTILSSRLHKFFVLVLFLMAACVEPYPPPESVSEARFFVVDGFLNASSKTATVKLSRSVPLSLNVPFPPEEGAQVSIEGDQGHSFTLSETDPGMYVAGNVEVDPAQNYQLHVLAKDGSSYRSDYVEIRRAPPIDSVSWRPEASGTRFYVSSHDPSNTTLFYRYLFTETWEYRVPIYSFWKKVAGLPVFRDPITEQVFTCWRSTTSTEVLTASTKRLSEDRVSMLPINFVRKGSRMLSRRYTINVQQRAISQAEFEYWELIRKTTETLGGLFDPLPSQVLGNVHNENDPLEQVLGYFSGGFVSEQRIFISPRELPTALQVVDGYDFTCEGKFVPIEDPGSVGNFVFVAQIGQPPIGWSSVPANCADCRTLGGDNIIPPFWVP